MLNEQLATCIKQHDLSNESVGESIGVSGRSIARWTTNVHEISKRNQSAVIDFLGRFKWCDVAPCLMVAPRKKVTLSLKEFKNEPWPGVPRARLEPDLLQAEKFLTLLDEETEEFTFQTFDDAKEGRPLARIFNGSLNDHWNKLVSLNNKGAGIYVTINKTDLKGRKIIHEKGD